MTGGLPLLWRSWLRHMVRRPGQMTLAVMGVALGVAVVVAVDLASRSAARAFELSTEAVTGRATHQVVGGPDGLPDSLFPHLVLTTGVTAAPVIEAYVTLPARPGSPARTLHVLGIDPFSEGGLRPHLGAGGADLSA
ncbi:MAG TPA: ABC transporter permease, partial [Thermoanaerobaculia bacterium]|nr:ABC transporter permease [Thermoanaerobaculia bacterium]